jgi:hypothetical protein
MKTVALGLSMSFVILIAEGARAQEDDRAMRQEVLALHRLELRPFGGWDAAPNSATGAFVGADVAVRLNRFFALGGDFAWYAPFDRSPGPQPSYPLNETLGSGDLDAYIVPWPARARSGAFEPYLVGGLGVIATRPIAVVDPRDRSFDANTLVDLTLGVGVRLFVDPRVAISLEVRDLMYFDKLENGRVATGPAVAPGQPGYTANSPLNPATWYSPDSHPTSAFQLRLGVSFFVLGG